MRRRDLLAGAVLLPASALTAPTPPAPKWLDVPFDGSADHLASDGHSFDKMFAAARVIPVRTDFESKGRYLERIAPLMVKTVYGKVSLSDRIGFMLYLSKAGEFEDDAGWAYDPEREMLGLRMPDQESYFGSSSDMRYRQLRFRVPDVVTSDGLEPGERKARSTAIQKVLEVKRFLEIGFPQGAGLPTNEASLAGEMAARNLPLAGLWVVGRLGIPFFDLDEHVTKSAQMRMELTQAKRSLVLVAEELVIANIANGAVLWRRSP